MSSLEDFSDILRRDEPLAPLTWMKVGGPAQFFLTPRNRDEVVGVVRCCFENEIPVRVLGGGSNILVRDEGVAGAVIKLDGESFSRIEIDGNLARTGSQTPLSTLVSHTVRAGLAGIENLAGIPGTVGGALRGNSGGRHGDIGQYVRSVTLLTSKGEEVVRTADELQFAYRFSNIDELLILSAEFQLQQDDPDEITRRLRKIWIMKKATQPLSFQSAGCIFKNPRGLSAGALIEQSGLKGTQIGNAKISERHANFIVTEPETSSADVLRLIDLARSKVAEQFGVDLELEINIW